MVSKRLGYGSLSDGKGMVFDWMLERDVTESPDETVVSADTDHDIINRRYAGNNRSV